MKTQDSPWASQSERERERAAKREALLRTAARFFNERGFHATSLDDVATSLNVTKPTLYHYFANKDEILFECTRRGLDAIAEAMAATTASGGSPAERLNAMLIAYALQMMDDFGICVARTQDSMLSPDSRIAFRALKRQIDEMLRTAISEGVAHGSFHVPNVMVAAFAVAQALNGLGNWYDPAGPLDRQTIAELTVATLMDGLRARG